MTFKGLLMGAAAAAAIEAATHAASSQRRAPNRDWGTITAKEDEQNGGRTDRTSRHWNARRRFPPLQGSRGE